MTYTVNNDLHSKQWLTQLCLLISSSSRCKVKINPFFATSLSILLLHLSSLCTLGKHHCSHQLVLPDHPPEVNDSVGQGTLGCYVSIGVAVALEVLIRVVTTGTWVVPKREFDSYIDVRGVHIVWSLYPLNFLQLHSREVICNRGQIPVLYWWNFSILLRGLNQFHCHLHDHCIVEKLAGIKFGGKLHLEAIDIF